MTYLHLRWNDGDKESKMMTSLSGDGRLQLRTADEDASGRRQLCEPRPGASLVELLLVVGLIGTLVSLALPAVQSARKAAGSASCRNNLRQLAIGLHHYQSVVGRLPSGRYALGSVYPIDPAHNMRPWDVSLSWTVGTLPYVGYENLHAAYTTRLRDDPRYDAEIEGFISTPVKPLLCPSHKPRTDDGRLAFTSYLGVAGYSAQSHDGLFYETDTGISLELVSDGLSQTLMLGERPTALFSATSSFGDWAGYHSFDKFVNEDFLGVRQKMGNLERCPCPEPAAHYKPYSLPQGCGWFAFWSTHHSGANWAFADGSVRFLAYSADNVLPTLSTIAGGEVVGDY